MKKRMGAALITLIASLGVVSFAQAQEQAKASGEVRRIDAAKGKIAIKHGMSVYNQRNGDVNPFCIGLEKFENIFLAHRLFASICRCTPSG